MSYIKTDYIKDTKPTISSWTRNGLITDGESSFGKRTSLKQQTQVEHGHRCAFPEVGFCCCDWLCRTVCLSVSANNLQKAMMVTTSSNGWGENIFSNRVENKIWEALLICLDGPKNLPRLRVFSVVSTVTWGLFHWTRTSGSGPASTSQHTNPASSHSATLSPSLWTYPMCLLLLTKLSKMLYNIISTHTCPFGLTVRTEARTSEPCGDNRLQRTSHSHHAFSEVNRKLTLKSIRKVRLAWGHKSSTALWIWLSHHILKTCKTIHSSYLTGNSWEAMHSDHKTTLRGRQHTEFRCCTWPTLSDNGQT